jgi:hypothetical protein
MKDDPADLPARPEEPGRSPAVTRSFSDKEVRDILRRATTLPADPDLRDPAGPSLEDLMAAAAEVGLDPAVVRRAAAIEASPSGGVAGFALGAPDRREVRAVLSGTTLPDQREALVRATELGLGRRGEVLESDPGRFEWREDHIAGRSRVCITEQNGSAEIRVSTDRAGHYVAGWFLGFLAWALVLGVTPVGLMGLLPKILSWIAMPVLLARPWWTRADRRLRARLEALTLDLARIVETHRTALPPN